MTRRVHIETWGCQMNVADSERMMALLHNADYESTTDPDQADLFLLNTCHIREKAKHKVLSRLGKLAKLKAQNANIRIAVAGCVAQAEGKKLLKAAPWIDVLLGPGKTDELPKLLRDREGTKKTTLALGFDRDTGQTAQTPQDHGTTSIVPMIPVSDQQNFVSRYVNIMQGCDNFCTFCVVPMTRGREISRSPEEIVSEVNQMLDQGAREITLLGQNVNSYGGTPESFVALLEKVAEQDRLQSLRFTTSNPHDFSESLAELFERQPKLGRYLHLPVQSGSDRILEKMHRKVTAQEFLTKVAWLRKFDSEFALSTDLIVGFPGETEEDFQATLDLVEKARFSFVYSFKYSPRRGTAAARFTDQVPEEVKEDRLQRLNSRQNLITTEINQKDINRQVQVLYHYRSRKEPENYFGRTPQYRLVRTRSEDNLVGKILNVKITDANRISLFGQL